jgi:hypothetical protein
MEHVVPLYCPRKPLQEGLPGNGTAGGAASRKGAGATAGPHPPRAEMHVLEAGDSWAPAQARATVKSSSAASSLSCSAERCKHGVEVGRGPPGAGGVPWQI